MPDPPAKFLDPRLLPERLKNMTLPDLEELSREIRAEIIRVVVRNGGHLASSLGAVDLIVALHHVFDAPEDRLVFDVGHQAYAHKILTGRLSSFKNIRLQGGVSGFPRRDESVYDPFGAGHSSTSISAALGMAAARDLTGSERRVAAVIGDGAITGGMALEAMNHAGGLNKNLLVVFNDNRMSISPNVGAISQYLSLKLTTPEHLQLREKVKGTLKKLMPKRGERLIRRFQGAEEALKSFLVSPSAFLAAWGFKYLGPIDGHDLGKLVEALRHVKSLQRPVFLHVLTTKGKGYAPAEDDPLGFHGVGKTGAPAPSPRLPDELPQSPAPEGGLGPPSGAGSFPRSAQRAPAPESFTEVFGAALTSLARENPKIIAVTAAMSQGTGLTEFFSKHPERSFDVGIAEQHAVTFAAGLASEGFRPVVAIYSTFLQRAFDQLAHDVDLQRLPVLFAVDRAGLVGEDGPTHHGLLDLSYTRLLPNFTIMAPSDAWELRKMLALGLSLPGPASLRYPRGAANRPPERFLERNEGKTRKPPSLGRGEVVLEGDDLFILALGSMLWPAVEAALELEDEGFRVGVANLRFVQPLDGELVLEKARESGGILTVEENSLTGGLKSAVTEALLENGVKNCKMGWLGAGPKPVEQATQAQQRALLGLDSAGIKKKALELLKSRL
ncbi:MAG: 1-deoxy-D-xylulose-5-phosphate synthase [Deltaproteobacteria bacterium]|jgi:1-deoxy-D-xylulose-5-phosphate synthase|nr:1-deoxy-D-xylulose-5-phosphate synthase [Deltaproteobacteria bacterium]